ncbi:MAG: hypothetical protein OIN85_00700 [Candidatus Methanoperedens sp.]|nr:hypothetical protein [Candidatus Methanoperedens sp.]
MTLVIGIFLGRHVPTFLQELSYRIKNKKALKSVFPTKVKKGNTCKTHSWFKVNSIDENGSEGKIDVCRSCGLVSGTDLAFSAEMIDRMEEDMRLEGLEKKIYTDFAEKEDQDIRKFLEAELKGGLDYKKIAKVHTAGMTFNYRLQAYRMIKNKEVQETLSRGNA